MFRDVVDVRCILYYILYYYILYYIIIYYTILFSSSDLYPFLLLFPSSSIHLLFLFSSSLLQYSSSLLLQFSPFFPIFLSQYSSLLPILSSSFSSSSSFPDNPSQSFLFPSQSSSSHSKYTCRVFLMFIYILSFSIFPISHPRII